MSDETYPNIPAGGLADSPLDASPLAGSPDAPRAKRSYTRRVPLSELAARRSAESAGREFKVQDGWVWQRRAADWKKVCREFSLLGFVVSADCHTAALDVLLPDGNTATLPAAAITEDGTERLEQWCAFNLIKCPEPRAAGFWLRSIIPDLRAVRTAPLRYFEDEERSSRHLIRIAEKCLGRSIRPALEHEMVTE